MACSERDGDLFDAFVDVVADDARLRCGLRGSGPVVLCAHGFPDNYRSYRHQIPALCDKNYRVVSVAMRGYEPSSVCQRGRYDVATLGRDLCQVAEAVSPDEPVRLIGHDWGAVAAFAASALRPERFSQLVTMAVPHLRVAAPRFATVAQARRSSYMARFQIRGRAERWLARDELALVEQLWRDWSPDLRCSAPEMDRVKEALRDRLPDVLGYYRQMVSIRAIVGESRRLVFAKTRVPSLHIHGEDDGCVGVELCEGLDAAYLDHFELLRVAGAGHFVHLEQPDLVNDALCSFFS